MALPTIGGVSVKFVSFSRLPDEVGGKVQRVVSGTLRGDVLWTARAWQGVAYCANDAEAMALWALAGIIPRTCVGDQFPGSPACILSIQGDPHERESPTTWRRMLTLSIREKL